MDNYKNYTLSMLVKECTRRERDASPYDLIVAQLIRDEIKRRTK